MSDKEFDKLLKELEVVIQKRQEMQNTASTALSIIKEELKSKLDEYEKTLAHVFQYFNQKIHFFVDADPGVTPGKIKVQLVESIHNMDIEEMASSQHVSVHFPKPIVSPSSLREFEKLSLIFKLLDTLLEEVKTQLISRLMQKLKEDFNTEKYEQIKEKYQTVFITLQSLSKRKDR